MGSGSGRKGLTISEVAERLGVNVHTLRYYESAGLMTRVGRATNGHRVYSEDDLHYLDLLRCLRNTGMSIQQIRRFSALVQAGAATASERLALMRDHRTVIETQRQLLDRAASLVDEKIRRYRTMTAGEQ